MHPGLVTVMVLAATLEIWLVFALMYAALQRHGGRNYCGRTKDALRLRL
jgi:hypothetical protein